MLRNWFLQVVSVTTFGIRTIPQRKGASIAAVIGIAGVVAVLVGALATARGFVLAMTASATPEGAMVMRSGADSEMMSGLSGEDTRIISDADGIANGREGVLSSAELFVIINLNLRSTGTDANVPLRGIEKAAYEVRGNIEFVEGRPLEWGKNELIVGVGAAQQFEGLNVGNSLQIGQDRWTVVGMFTSGGGIAESELWTDATVLQGAYRRGNSYQSVHVRLENPESFDSFKDSLTTDPRLNVKVIREGDYYAEQSQVLKSLIMGVGWMITILMAVGALFGALNTMYSAVSTRTREIATLRALGFRAGPVVLSIMMESVFLAVLGGLIGGLAMFAMIDGFRTGTMNWQSFSQVTFALEVSPQLLLTGIILAAFIGMFGGLFPAIRAATMPIATALREL